MTIRLPGQSDQAEATLGSDPVNVLDYEWSAKERLPPSVYDYVAGGATDEASVSRNRRAFAAWSLRPRVLSGVSSVDLRTTVLGAKVSLPVLIAPCGGHSKVHPDGEAATLRAGASAGTIVVVSANSSTSFGDLATHVDTIRWLQTYPFRDRAVTVEWLREAERSGYAAVCVTLDSQWPPKRERNLRNDYRPPAGVNLGAREPGGALRTQADPAASWADLAWMVGQTSLPVVAKGIMAPEDVSHAIDAGAQAVIISNHGGRQLDGTLATIEVLPDAIAVADGRIELLLDGGIRRGADVVKALALGAKAVLVGRPAMWGLAVAGEAGVRSVLEILGQEVELTLAKCGVSEVERVPPDVVVRTPILPADPHQSEEPGERPRLRSAREA
jgi:4-hydroxymandelate oxidase